MSQSVVKEKFGDTLVSSGVMAELLAMSSPNLAQREDDIPPAEKRGRMRVYKMRETLHQYIGMLREGNADNTVAGRRLKLVKQQERKLRLANDEAAGLLTKSDTVVAELQEIVSIMRAGADALPGRVAQQLSGMTKPSEIRGLLEQELDEIFAMAEASLRVYAETLGLGDQSEGEEANADSADGSGTATKKVSRRVGGRKQGTAKGKRGTRKVA